MIYLLLALHLLQLLLLAIVVAVLDEYLGEFAWAHFN